MNHKYLKYFLWGEDLISREISIEFFINCDSNPCSKTHPKSLTLKKANEKCADEYFSFPFTLFNLNFFVKVVTPYHVFVFQGFVDIPYRLG